MNGATVSGEGRAVLVNGVILVPLFVLAERLDLATSWLEETKTVRLEAYGRVLYLPQGQKVALVDGRSLKLAEPAQVIGDRMMVPLRFLAEILKFEVTYSSAKKRVEIKGPEYGVRGVSFTLVDGRPQIRVSATRTPRATVTLRQNPLRYVVDLNGGRLLTPAGALPTNDPLLGDLTWKQEKPDLVRLTISAGREMPYALETEGDGLRLTFPPQVRTANLLLDGGRRMVVIQATAPLKPSVKRLTDPDRLVVDLPGVTSAGPSRVPVDDAWVHGIRLGQLDPNTVRVVVDLEGPLGWVEEPAVRQENGVPGTTWSLHLYNRVLGVTTQTLQDRTQVRLKLAVGAVPSVVQDRPNGRIELDLPEAVAEGLPGELAVDDGTVNRLKLLEAGPATVRWNVELPYYVGHQALAGKREAVLEVSRSPLYRKKVFLDPGHGGSDPGAIAPGGLQEKEVNLDLALRLRQLLLEAGAEVVLSRDADVFIPLYDRPRAANSLPAEVFVSIHNNANYKPGECGSEVYFHPDHPGSRELAAQVQKRLVESLGLFDRQIKPNREFVVIRETTMPGILVEVAFLSNPGEEKALGDAGFRQRAAAAIADGIRGYFAELPLPL